MITETQRQERTKGLGSSDVPKILGIVPSAWGGPWDVWAEKVGMLEPREGEDPIKARIGGLIEPVARRLLEDDLGERVVASTGTFVSGCLRSNIDAFVGQCKRGNPIAEIKSTGYTSEWGNPDDGVDAIPDRHVVQVHAQLICAESDVAYIPLITADRGMGYARYTVRRSDELCKEIVALCEEWWDRHVVRGVEPDRTNPPPAFETLSRVRRRAGAVVRIDEKLVRLYAEAHEACKAAEARKDEARRTIAAFLGDAEGGECAAGRVTYYAREAERFDSARFRAENPELWAKYSGPVTGARVLMVYPKKAAKVVG